VPEELRERIESLRDRMDALQTELAEAMRELRRPRAAALTGAQPASSTPHYVDRRI
jgi:phosphate uptake regulator